MTNNKEAREKTGPTPKRKDAQARNRRPLVTGRKKLSKEEKAQQRKKRDQIYQKQRLAMEGKAPERYLPLKDQGIIRRKTRDIIDSRWTLSEWMLPIMFFSLVPSMVIPRNSAWAYGPIIVVYGMMLLALLEIILTNRYIRRRLREDFPTREIPSGQGFYVSSRMLMIRRWRQPKAMVRRGEKIS
ncbi:MAG: DUF3043 domain-containing protein [Actinomycetaceae bacterium]|nr:DUF3043 domain-containing protein [Actinomycetaceae bacterium]